MEDVLVLVNRQWLTPSDLNNLDSRATDQACGIASGSKRNDTPVLSVAAGQDLASDGHTSQSTVARYVSSKCTLRHKWKKDSPKAYDGVSGSVIPAVILGLAELPDTDRRQADVATTSKSEE